MIGRNQVATARSITIGPAHLMLGYHRWLASKQEWEKSGMKPLLFVMTEDNGSGRPDRRAFNNDPLYQELNGKTINLHTRLKAQTLPRTGRGHQPL